MNIDKTYYTMSAELVKVLRQVFLLCHIVRLSWRQLEFACDTRVLEVQ